MKSLTDRAGSGQVNPFVQVDVTVFKRDRVASLKFTGQAGIVLELDTPGRDNNRTYEGKAGAGAFFGLTATFGEHDDPDR